MIFVICFAFKITTLAVTGKTFILPIMLLIRIEFDDHIVTNKEASLLSVAVRDLVSIETGIADVFVYTNTALIKVQTAPIEIFVEMSAKKITDLDDLFERIKQQIIKWKGDSGFIHPVNLTIIPMNWKFEVGI